MEREHEDESTITHPSHGLETGHSSVNYVGLRCNILSEIQNKWYGPGVYWLVYDTASSFA
mgnify:CR=1 FL=1